MNLRAERVGPMDGRVYSIIVECSDDSENIATRTTQVNVPHSMIYGTVSGDLLEGEIMSLYKASCGTNLLVDTVIIDEMGQYDFGPSLPRGTYTVAPLNPDFSLAPELIEVIIPQLVDFGPYNFTATD